MGPLDDLYPVSGLDAATSAGYLRAHPVTIRQQEVLRVISVVCERHGVPPTVRELVSLLGLGSTMAVASHLKSLERKGLIERMPGRARTVRLTAAGKAVLR